MIKKALLLTIFIALVSLSLDWLTKHIMISEGEVALYNESAPAPHILFLLAASAIFLSALGGSFLISISAGLVLGGASGNILGRTLFGPVPDFIPLPFSYYGNIADVCIAAGSLLLVASYLYIFFPAPYLRKEKIS